MRGEEVNHACKMNLHLVILSCCSLLCNVAKISCESNDGKCVSLVNGPFDICTKAGYNNTLPFPKELTAELQTEIAVFLSLVIPHWKNCSSVELAAALECSFLFPKCNSEGRPVLPCRRVCGELLKHCYNQTVQTGPDYLEIIMNVILSECLTLPDENPSTKKCFEPPNFTTNDTVKSEYSFVYSVFNPLLFFGFIFREGLVTERSVTIGGEGGAGMIRVPTAAVVLYP